MYTKEITFVETAAAGVYTGTVSVRAGTRLLDASWLTTATFDADTASLDVGYSGEGNGNAFFSGEDVSTGDTTAALTDGESVGEQGHKFDAADTITAVLTTTGAGGITGRCTVLLVLARPISTTAATKVAS